MKTNKVENVKRVEEETHGGATTYRISADKELRRSVMSCFLWEDSFYENGIDVAERIKELVPKVSPIKVASIAMEARHDCNLRHVPLFLVREMARHDSHKRLVADTLTSVIQRADEMGEFLALYYKGEDKDIPISSQVKRGLCNAFNKFNEYQFAKYSKGAFTPRDVMFLVHPRPNDSEQEKLFGKIANKTLATPDTWEVELSANKGQNKKESWERLLTENKLGALALLRNLRNMISSGVEDRLIRNALTLVNIDKILPFRFISAAKYAPKFEPELEALMFSCLKNRPMLLGKTILVIDVSGSMNGNLSMKSELTRLDAASALSILAREICQEVAIYTTAGNDTTQVHKTELIASRRGFALRDMINSSAQHLGGGGIFTQQVVNHIHLLEKNADRMIIFSDSQDTDHTNKPENTKTFTKHNYLIDISSYKNGIAYNKFTQINGFSESTLDYIYHAEEED